MSHETGWPAEQDPGVDDAVVDILLRSRVPVAIFKWRNAPGWPVKFVSPNVEHVLGYDAEDFLTGRVVYAKIIHPDDLERVSQEVAEHSASGAAVFEHEDYRVLGPAGELRWVQDHTAIQRDPSGEITHYLGYILDITARKAAQQALREAKLEAERANQAKSDFLAVVSHELRTPMHGIIGWSGLLLDTELSGEQRELAESARHSAQNLLTIVNEILDFSRLGARPLELKEAPFELDRALADAVDLVALEADAKGLELLWSVEPGLPWELRGDPGRLRQVLVNLLGNAVKFTAEGEVELRVSRVVGEPLRLRFSVRDTGPGIPAGEEERIFEPFTQGKPFARRRHQGTGLGLAISQGLVEQMGGSIGCENRPGEGVTFWFVLPCAPTEAGARPAPSAALAGRRVLVAEGRPVAREHLRRLCGELGLEVEVASSAGELTARLAAAPAPEVLVVSEELPGLCESPAWQTLRGGSGPAPVALRRFRRQLDWGQARVRPLRKPVDPGALARELLHALDESLDLPDEGEVAWETLRARVQSLRARTLVVDDNPLNQRLMARVLERIGFRSDVASTGEECLAALELHPYDIILMDCQMPGMDGFATTRAVRALPGARSRTRIVALTAHAQERAREACLAAGMDDYLTKPLLMPDLRSVIERWLRATGAEAS